MSFLNIFKKKSEKPEPLSKRVLGLKSKRINYVYEDFKEFLALQRLDGGSFVKLTPVNYYAVKNEYIEGQYFFSPDYSECYVKFVSYSGDKPTDRSEIFTIGTDDLVKAFSKVGVIVNLPTEENV